MGHNAMLLQTHSSDKLLINLHPCFQIRIFLCLILFPSGVLLVYDPFARVSPSIESFYKYFVSGQNLKDEHCLVFANCKSNDEKNSEISSPLPSVSFVSTVTHLIFRVIVIK